MADSVIDPGQVELEESPAAHATALEEETPRVHEVHEEPTADASAAAESETPAPALPPSYGTIGSGGPDEDDLDGEDEFRFMARQFNSVLKPVCLTMILVIWIVNQLSEVRRQTRSSSYNAILVYQENDNDSGGSKFGGALLNALIFVGIILVATCVIVVLYKYRCLKAIYGWLIMSCVSLLGFFGGLTLWQILEINGLPIDWLSLAFIVWNFAVVGIIAIFWRAPLLMQQGYLVAVSALLAVNLTNLPEWTTWMILAAVAVYDLFAVLAPRGPLKVLVETSQERNEPIPGLVYNAESVKLGLGDFIFYSILVARGATIGDDTTVAACYIAILAGMCGTIMLLALVKKALPALPFSIGLGIIFYFLTRAVVVPYIGQFSTQQIYL